MDQIEVEDIIWGDFESASDVKLKASGAWRYATDISTRAIVYAYAIGFGPVRVWHADGEMLDWDNAPEDLKEAVEAGTRYTCTWNSFFDRSIWNYATLGFPELEVEDVIDAMTVATRSNLPADLESASKYIGRGGKQEDGKKLIKLFCVDRKRPADYPMEWQRFLTYAIQDVEEMREIWRTVKPMPYREWDEYWAFERINQRGLKIDLPFVEAARDMAAIDLKYTNNRVSELTGGALAKITQTVRIAEWVWDNIGDAEARGIIEVHDDDDEDEDDEPDYDEEPVRGDGKLSIARKRIASLIGWFEKGDKGGKNWTEVQERVRELVSLREFGGSTTPKKYTKMLDQHVGGVIRGQYTFSGAPQTGRMSSRGIQIHNLSRDTVGKKGINEEDTIVAICDGASHEELRAMEPVDMPVTRKLSLLIRPALVADKGKVFCAGDWSSIEARTLPWLANTETAIALLDVFRNNDANPDEPDVYEMTAARMLGKPAGYVDEGERQIGKICVLALGFAGGKGALQSMASNYRMYFSDEEAQRYVYQFRDANPWAPIFWDELWDAAMMAWRRPGTVTGAGRIAFMFDPRYMGVGALMMFLPSGRTLFYPSMRRVMVPVFAERADGTKEVVGSREEITFRRERGRLKLWKGIFAENATQAVAADVLRGTVTRIEFEPTYKWLPIRGHTHDEILIETEEHRAIEARDILRNEMRRGFAWSEGLPLFTEETISKWYTKAKVLQP